MENVKSILATKGSEVISVSPDALVIEAMQRMADKNIGAILVIDQAGEVVGIFSERDFARKIIVKGRSCETTKVREIMSDKIVFVDHDASIEDCMGLMTTNKFRHLPVKAAGKLVGIVSIGDVVKALVARQARIISEQAFEIGQNDRMNKGAI